MISLLTSKHFLIKKVESKEIELVYIPTDKSLLFLKFAKNKDRKLPEICKFKVYSILR